MSRILAIALLEARPERENRKEEQELTNDRSCRSAGAVVAQRISGTHNTVVESVSDPLPEGRFGEEGVALTKLV